MSTARAVLEAERLHVVSHLGERGRSGAAGQSGADDDYVDEALVGRVHQPDVVLVVRPLVRQVSLRNLGVERDTVLGHLRHLFFDSERQAWVMYMNTTMAENNTGTSTLKALPRQLMMVVYRGWRSPTDWKPLEKPCQRWKPRAN